MSPWPPRRSTGGDAAAWAAAVAGGLAVLLLVGAALQPPGPAMLALAALSLPLGFVALALGVWALSYRQLLYVLGDDNLRVQWLGRSYSVPYGAVEGIYTGQRLVGHAVPDVFSWPGVYVGPGRLRGLGRLRFFTTSQDPSALTLISFDQGGVVLSARNPHEFRLALIERVQQVDEAADPPPRAGWMREPLPVTPWSAVLDRWVWLSLFAGALLVLAMLGVIALRFDELPALVPLRFDAGGVASQLVPPGDLLRLPLLGLLVLLVNHALAVWLHARDQLLARILCTGGAVVGLVLLVAVIRLVQ